jgi:hypothetical protein
VLGVIAVPSSAWTEASYSAFVIRRTLGGNSTVPPGITWQLPFTHIPLQAWLHPPQWTLLFITSTQAFEQSIWPAAEQPQTPALQTAPSGHGLQPPQ